MFLLDTYTSIASTSLLINYPLFMLKKVNKKEFLIVLMLL
ncbi:hypothetical protein LMIV_0836 [Listeria monocytogenes FSL J1-208]|nr:hypothetical protein LMIV_0836 [Listeria monocytogenes FSL J1-208]